MILDRFGRIKIMAIGVVGVHPPVNHYFKLINLDWLCSLCHRGSSYGRQIRQRGKQSWKCSRNPFYLPLRHPLRRVR
jgi:hypothetical protein